MTPLNGKRLGIMVGAEPASANYKHAMALAAEAHSRGVEVYLYFIDDAVAGMKDERLQEFKRNGLRLFACAFSLQKRNLPLDCPATLAGLTLLNDVLASTDRFVSFT